MGLIWEYLRNPATFWRRQAIGCVSGCLGIPIILGFIAVVIFVIENRIGSRWVLLFGAVLGAIIFTVLSIGFFLYKGRMNGR